MARIPRTPREGNARPARLLRWLESASPPPEYCVLNLETKNDGEWSILQRFERTSENMTDLVQLSSTIDDMIQGHADELGSFVQGRAAFATLDQPPRYWTTCDLRCPPSDMDAKQAFAGDVQSTLIQSLRHTEDAKRMHHGGFQTVIAVLERQIDRSDSRVEELTRDNERLRGELAARDEAMAAMRAQAEEALTAAEQAQEREATAKEQTSAIATVTSIVKQHIGGGGAAPPAPAKQG